MSILLDTHAFLWWLTADPRLSAKAKAFIDDGESARYVSSVTAFEIANKVRIGKLDFAREISERFNQFVNAGNFHRLDISMQHALLAGQMTGEHKDPFDRLLAAQCKLDGLSLVSADTAFRQFELDILW